MATEVITTTVCDLCEREGTKTYTIREGSRAKRVDICEKHNDRIEMLMKKGSPVPRRRRG